MSPLWCLTKYQHLMVFSPQITLKVAFCTVSSQIIFIQSVFHAQIFFLVSHTFSVLSPLSVFNSWKIYQFTPNLILKIYPCLFYIYIYIYVHTYIYISTILVLLPSLHMYMNQLYLNKSPCLFVASLQLIMWTMAEVTININ